MICLKMDHFRKIAELEVARSLAEKELDILRTENASLRARILDQDSQIRKLEIEAILNENVLTTSAHARSERPMAGIKHPRDWANVATSLENQAQSRLG